MSPQLPKEEFRFATVILAAGASSRMGQPKLLLPWRDDKTILAHLIQQWKDLEAVQIAVVVEPQSPLEAHLGKIDRIVNPQAESGMFSSVRSAASWEGWNKDAITHFVVALGDQPHLGLGTLKAIVNFAAENADYICQPARNGRPRHPVIMPKAVFLGLPEAKEANLKDFLCARESQRKTFESDDAALDLDIDTPEDYWKLVK